MTSYIKERAWDRGQVLGNVAQYSNLSDVTDVNNFPQVVCQFLFLSVALISVFVFALLCSVTGLPSLYSIVEKI